MALLNIKKFKFDPYINRLIFSQRTGTYKGWTDTEILSRGDLIICQNDTVIETIVRLKSFIIIPKCFVLLLKDVQNCQVSYFM